MLLTVRFDNSDSEALAIQFSLLNVCLLISIISTHIARIVHSNDSKDHRDPYGIRINTLNTSHQSVSQ